jgi:imidazolonepropionase-like amidohydrolase
MPALRIALVALVFATACGRGDQWVLVNVHVVDVEVGTTARDVAIVIVGNRTAAVGPIEELDVPRGARQVDGGGGYVIPGLWDMHVHLTHAGEDVLPLMIANGVTGARDMGGDLAVVDSLRASIARGETIGPRIVRTGRWVDGQKELDDRYILETPEEGRAAVAELAAAGVDHIKVHNGLPRDVFFAVLDEAKRRGLRPVGHVPMGVYPAEAIDAGLVTVEHVATIFEGMVAGSLRDPMEQLRVIRAYSSRGADTLAGHFVEHGAWFTPTLVAYAVNSRLPDLEANPDPRRKYLRPAVVEHWDENFPIQPYELDPVVVAFRKRGDTAFAELVTAFDAHGVALLAATDLGAREIYPGFSLHDELALLVERAGLTPLTALRSATLNPARYLAADSLGAVTKEALADFVVLEGNPLEDIRNTARIRAVIFDGRYFPRIELDEVLATAAERAAGMGGEGLP